MHVDVEALGGQRDVGKNGTLLIALGGLGLSGSLSLLLGGEGGFGGADDRLLFLVAGRDGETEQGQRPNRTNSGTCNHLFRIAGLAWAAVRG